MKPFTPLASLGLVLALALGLALWWVWGPDRRTVPEPVSVLAMLGGADGTGFQTPSPDWSPSLPADHAAHPGFRAELWTISGDLRDEAGRRYGFQLSMVRLALSPSPAERSSAWATNQIYRAHFTVMPEGAGAALAAERLSRAALDLAGSSSNPARVWVRDWSLEAKADGAGLTLIAEAPGARLELELQPQKPVLSGASLDLLPASSDGPAFAFYVLPRLAARGVLTREGQPLTVTGLALMDHGWGAVPGLGPGAGGPSVNRFAVQLDDGRDLICLLLQRQDGSGRPIPSCALALADGRVQTFRRRELELAPVREWRSPGSGRVYPVAWSIAIEPIGLRLALDPLSADQELTRMLPLWSGAVSVSGTDAMTGAGGTSVTGSGRIELTPAGASGPDDRDP
jgi:predicted secreted hydrolase